MNNWSLRRQISLLLLMGLLPVLFLAAALTYQNFLQARTRVEMSIQATAGDVAAAAYDFVRSTQDSLQLLTEFPAVRQMDSAEAGRLLEKTLALRPWLLNLYLADEGARVVASAVPDAAVAGRDAVPYLSNAAAFSYPSVSGRIDPPGLGKPTAMVTVPLRDSFGRRIGMVAADIELRELQWNWANRPAARDEQIVVVDSSGAVLVHTDVRMVSSGRNLAGWAPVAALQRRERGLAEFQDPETGLNWIAAYTPVRGSGWGVIVITPSGAVLAEAVETGARQLALVLLVAFAASSLGFLFSRGILQPVGRLRESAKGLLARLSAEGLPLAEMPNELKELDLALQGASDRLSSLAAELGQARAEVSTYRAELVTAAEQSLVAQEEQRRRIAEEIHDGATQLMVGALFEAQNTRRYASDSQEVLARLETIGRLLQESIAEIRGAIGGLYPVQLERVGLAGAVESLADQFSTHHGIPCEVSFAGQPYRPTPMAQLYAYRIVQESLQNCAKHAQAVRVSVTLSFGTDEFRLSVDDDGRGFDPDAPPVDDRCHLGLQSMRDRAQLAGGRLDIRSAPGRGTSVILSIPTAAVLASPDELVRAEEAVS